MILDDNEIYSVKVEVKKSLQRKTVRIEQLETMMLQLCLVMGRMLGIF